MLVPSSGEVGGRDCWTFPGERTKEEIHPSMDSEGDWGIGGGKAGSVNTLFVLLVPVG